MQIKEAATVYDVCIVGSGAGGGTAAYLLTRAGANVVMLEAGQWWDSAKDSKMMAWPYDSPRRGAPNKERAFGEFDGVFLLEAPDNATAASVAMAVGASGALSEVETTVLLDMDEAQDAMRKAAAAKYRPPNS